MKVDGIIATALPSSRTRTCTYLRKSLFLSRLGAEGFVEGPEEVVAREDGEDTG